MAYQYMTAPFSGITKGNDPSPGRTLAAQLQEIINDASKKGWEFYRIDTVNVLVSPGCLASLLGQKNQLVQYDIVIFRKTT